MITALTVLVWLVVGLLALSVLGILIALFCLWRDSR